MVNTGAFRGTNIETAKHWSLGAFGQGPFGMPFFHLTETSGEAIRLKGIGSPAPQRSKEKRNETFFQICVGMVGCGFCIGSAAGAGSPKGSSEESSGAGSQHVGRSAGVVE